MENEKIDYEVYSGIETYYVKDPETGKLKAKKFNYHEYVNSQYDKVKKQLQTQIEQALLLGVKED